jgi:hypothetical protein
MKIENPAVKQVDGFEPLEMKIAFENKEELAEFYAIFNTTAIVKTKAMRSSADKIRKYIINSRRLTNMDVDVSYDRLRRRLENEYNYNR